MINNIFALTFALCALNDQSMTMKDSFYCSRNILRPRARRRNDKQSDVWFLLANFAQNAGHTILHRGNARQQASIQRFHCNLFLCNNIEQKKFCDNLRRSFAFKLVLFQGQCSQLLRIQFLTNFVSEFCYEVTLSILIEKSMILFCI